MDLHEQLKEIKTQLRLSMNGVASQSMREKGLVYKLNFGVELPRLKEIASTQPHTHELAQALWKENIRECKILATLLQPVDSFCPEIADIWVESIQHQELAEMASMNLFQRLPYASELAFRWIAMEQGYFPVCGYLILTRLFMSGAQLSERAENEYLDQVCTDLAQKGGRLQHTALKSILRFVDLNPHENGRKVLRLLADLKQSESQNLRAIYEEIKAETEYFK